MKIANVDAIAWLVRVVVGAIVATSLTACIVEPVRFRPVRLEPVAVHVVVHDRY